MNSKVEVDRYDRGSQASSVLCWAYYRGYRAFGEEEGSV